MRFTKSRIVAEAQDKHIPPWKRARQILTTNAGYQLQKNLRYYAKRTKNIPAQEMYREALQNIQATRATIRKHWAGTYSRWQQQARRQQEIDRQRTIQKK